MAAMDMRPQRVGTTTEELAGAAGDVLGTVTRLVPSAVALSVTLRDGGAPYTLVATDERTATLDAVQYAEGGPCVDCVTLGSDVPVQDTLAEQRWSGFGVAAALRDVRSTLSVAGQGEGRTVAINLHASEPGAFDAAEDDVREAVAALAELALEAPPRDLSARTAPAGPLGGRDGDVVELAAGVIAAAEHVTLDQARSRLPDAAVRASVAVPTVARAVIGED